MGFVCSGKCNTESVRFSGKFSATSEFQARPGNFSLLSNHIFVCILPKFWLKLLTPQHSSKGNSPVENIHLRSLVASNATSVVFHRLSYILSGHHSVPTVCIQKHTNMDLTMLFWISGEEWKPAWNLLMTVHPKLDLQGTARVDSWEKAAVTIVSQTYQIINYPDWKS